MSLWMIILIIGIAVWLCLLIIGLIFIRGSRSLSSEVEFHRGDETSTPSAGTDSKWLASMMFVLMFWLAPIIILFFLFIPISLLF